MVREAVPPPGRVRRPALPVRSPVRRLEAIIRDMGKCAEDLKCGRYSPPQRAVIFARVPTALPPKCFPWSSFVKLSFSAATITEGRVQRQVADERGEGAVQVALGKSPVAYSLKCSTRFLSLYLIAAWRFVDAAYFVSVPTPSSDRTSRSTTSTL